MFELFQKQRTFPRLLHIMKTTSSALNEQNMDGIALLALMDDADLHQWMGLFHRATGLAIRLLPVGLDFSRGTMCGHEHGFCRDAGVKGSAVCCKTRRSLNKKLAAKLVPQQVVCDTGMTEVAVPVTVSGRHVGTFLVGQTFLKKPSVSSWSRLAATVAAADKKRLMPLRNAYLNGGVIPDDTLDLLVRMVSLHAKRLEGMIEPPKKSRKKAKSTRRTR